MPPLGRSGDALPADRANGGCLSLSLFNREIPETKERLDQLEKRVSALEARGTNLPSEPVYVPTPPPQVISAPPGR